MEKEYIRAVNGLIEVGDESFFREDYALAGRSFRKALDAYPLAQSHRERVSRSPKKLKSNLDACCNTLMEQGLREYRRGKLEGAISKWKGLLAINPGHTEARKALETASVQLEALQNIEKGQSKR